MPISSILELALGLAFIYLSFSLICSTLDEFVMGWLKKKRAQELRAGLVRMLGADLTSKLYAHPSIKTLAEASGDAVKGPSYISSAVFAQALLGVLSTDPNNPVTPLSDQERLQALRGNLAGGGKDASIKQLVAESLGTAAEAEQLKSVQTRLETWFDDAMERLSGLYKRHAQMRLLGWAFLVVVAFNVDSLYIVTTLWEHPAVLAAVVAEAEQLVQDPSEASGDQSPPCPSPTPDDASSGENSASVVLECVSDGVKGVEDLGIPLGWGDGWWNWNSPENLADPRLPHDCGEVLLKIVGLLVSIFALTQGAPFWFQVLNKFVNLRASGPPPAQSSTSESSGGETAS
jgi:hypothetical protein